MSRRSKPPNRVGCKPDYDVCVEHDVPLECRHGCKYAALHKCKERPELGQGESTKQNHRWPGSIGG